MHNEQLYGISIYKHVHVHNVHVQYTCYMMYVIRKCCMRNSDTRDIEIGIQHKAKLSAVWPIEPAPLLRIQHVHVHVHVPSVL